MGEFIVGCEKHTCQAVETWVALVVYETKIYFLLAYIKYKNEKKD